MIALPALVKNVTPMRDAPVEILPTIGRLANASWIEKYFPRKSTDASEIRRTLVDFPSEDALNSNISAILAL